MNVDIYIPQESVNVFRFHINNLANRTFDNWSFYHDPELFKQCQGNKRIACFQLPYPWNDDIENKINDVYNFADHVLIIGSELHIRTADFIRRFDRPKVTYFLCGYMNGGVYHAPVKKFLDWFTTTVYFYKHIRPTTLFDLRPMEIKPLMFDALLGRKKPHRDQAYKFIHDNKLDSQGIITYVNDHQINFDDNDPDRWQWQSEGIENFDECKKNIEYTVDRVKYYGYEISISQIMPISIYNQTAYSLVCETNFDTGHVFFTEKTVKPILARRLFITLGNQYHLASLRRLGFKTFSDIIDESYDTIENPSERHAAALEQLRWLCNQNQEDILCKIQPIVDHNFNHMYTHDWYNLFRMDFGDYFFSRQNRAI